MWLGKWEKDQKQSPFAFHCCPSPALRDPLLLGGSHVKGSNSSPNVPRVLKPMILWGPFPFGLVQGPVKDSHIAPWKPLGSGKQ